ncbi:MAG: hypothetical protein DMG68_17770 [Acidobacteria bacterium]|nr:MAG: hypothetical protein DMG68_17770 [Acidobacteriota bacterium]
MTLFAPRVYKELLQIKLIDVEAAGISVESQTITNQVLDQFKVASSPRTLAFFVPYTEIALVIGSAEGPSLHEKSFLG